MKQLATYTIGTLAQEARVGVETVRFYERKGLIDRPARRSSGYRQYSAADAQRIRFIKRAQDLGFTLKEIKDLLALELSSKMTCGDLRKKADSKLKEVEEKIRDLQRMKKSLKDISSACGDGKQAASQCRILDCFESDWKC